MRLPAGRGPVSELLIETLSGAVGALPGELERCWRAGGQPGPAGGGPAPTGARPGDGLLYDEDLQLTLFICYELHYRGWDGVAEEWEWAPDLLALRARAERLFLGALRRTVGDQPVVEPAQLSRALNELVARDDGPPLSTILRRRASIEQFREFVIHRSIYHLREADPHTWGIPRLTGRTKAALVEIQADEYGGGRFDRMHSELFRSTMRWLGLCTVDGHYLPVVPAVTLAANNLISFFGLHRRWRGALLGHLAAFEMTSSLPNRRYGDGLRRLGGGPTATRFYDEHVEADAVHEQIAVADLCGSFAEAEPDRVGDVLFGAACALALDGCAATQLLADWAGPGSSLRRPVPDRVPSVTVPFSAVTRDTPGRETRFACGYHHRTA